MNEIIKQNKTKEKKEKILNILKDKAGENFKIIKTLTEKNDLKEIMKNMYMEYKFKIDGNSEKLKDYLERQFINNLNFFLKEDNYNMTKAPQYKINNENNEITLKFLNLFEVNGMSAVLSQKKLEKYEEYLKETLDFMFMTKFNIKEINEENKQNTIINNNITPKKKRNVKFGL